MRPGVFDESVLDDDVLDRERAISRRALLGGGVALSLLLASSGAGAAKKSGRAWLGVAMSTAPMGGVLVDFVFKTSPAEKAALRRGDMLVRADGVPLDSPRDMVAHVKHLKPGMTVKLVVRRGGRERNNDIVLASHPGSDEVVRLLHVGNKAYEPSLVAVQGTVPSKMRDLRGKVVLVDFFASWCANCRLLTPTLARWHRRYGKRGLSVLGITSDATSLARETTKKWKIPYAVGSDAGQATQARYRVSAIPALFLVDRKGVIRDVMIGYEPSRRAATEKLIEKLLAER